MPCCCSRKLSKPSNVHPRAFKHSQTHTSPANTFITVSTRHAYPCSEMRPSCATCCWSRPRPPPSAFPALTFACKTASSTRPPGLTCSPSCRCSRVSRIQSSCPPRYMTACALPSTLSPLPPPPLPPTQRCPPRERGASCPPTRTLSKRYLGGGPGGARVPGWERTHDLYTRRHRQGDGGGGEA